MPSYLDYACIGKPSISTIEAMKYEINSFLEWNQPGTLRTLELFEKMEECRNKVAQLVNVKPENIALMNNTTQSLGVLASLIPINSNENIIIPDIEFMSASIVWRERQKRIGFEIRSLKTFGGKFSKDDIQRVMDENTRVIMISSVQEVSGFRADLKELMSLAKDRGAWLLVDGIQEVGVLEVNLNVTPVHAYCAGGHKWLGNPFGLGFMYLSPELREELKPSYVGYLGLQEPKVGWNDYLKNRERTPFDRFDIMNEARVYESGGTPPWLAAVGLTHAITAIHHEGIIKIQEKVFELHDHLRDHLRRIGLKKYILGHGRDEFQSGILTFSLPGGLPQEEYLLQKLSKNDVFVSLRSISGIGGIRVSPYYTNTLEDIDRLVEITEGFLN